PAPGTVSAVPDAHRRSGRRLRSGAVQRSPPARLEGDDVRGRAAHYTAALAAGLAGQGTPGRTGAGAAYGLRARRVRRTAPRSGRASAAGDSPGLPQVRRAGDRQRAVALPRRPPDPAGDAGARWPGPW